MDPSPFLRITIDSLTLKLSPATSKPAGKLAGVHPSTASPYYCTVALPDCTTVPPQHSALALAADHRSTTALIDPPPLAPPPPLVLTLDEPAARRLAAGPAGVVVTVHSGRTGSCWFGSGRVLGRVAVRVGTERAGVVHSGWVSVGTGRFKARLFLVVRSEPDPRFVFWFGGEPECSPVVYQVGGRSGGARQPVFSCRFTVDRRRSSRCQSVPAEECNKSNKFNCFKSFKQNHHKPNRPQQRKGWTVTIHDLSGTPVAAASMVTPFVPSPSSDRVSASNPGCWLILRNTTAGALSGPTWKPWGRLQAWRDPDESLGYRFELVDENKGVSVADSTSVTIQRGGRFCIEPSEVCGGALVMASSVEGEGRASRPTVEVGVRYIACMADAAAFIALAAAVDLSMDACRLFSQKLRRELCACDQDEC